MSASGPLCEWCEIPMQPSGRDEVLWARRVASVVDGGGLALEHAAYTCPACKAFVWVAVSQSRPHDFTWFDRLCGTIKK